LAYVSGAGVAEDLGEAARLFGLAAARGDDLAARNLREVRRRMTAARTSPPRVRKARLTS